MDKDINKRKAVEAIWENPEPAFGGQWKRGRDSWEYQTGCEWKQRGAVRLLRTRNGEGITVFFNHGSGQAGRNVDVFTFLMEAHGYGFLECLQQLSKDYGFELELNADQRHSISRAALCREITPIFVNALKKNQDGEAAAYLNSRGVWDPFDGHFGELTEDSLKKAKEALNAKGMTYDEKDFEELGLTPSKVKDGYNVVIPYTSNGSVKGFKLRGTRQGRKPKYLDSKDLGREGYCDRLEPGEPAVIVEGQFDAVRLIQAGVKNVIAIGGNSPSDDILQKLKAYNVKEVTYVPDTEYDAEGHRKTDIMHNIISGLQKTDPEGERYVNGVYVAVLPAPEGQDLKNYKIDADDYGRQYGPEALKEEVKNGILWYDWELQELIDEAKKHERETGSVNITWFRDKFDGIYGRAAIGYERQALKDFIAREDVKQYFELFGITPEALTDLDELKRNKEYSDRVKAGVKKLQEATKDEGKINPVEVKAALAELNEAQTTNTREEWDAQLDQSFESELEDIRSQKETLKTKWQLGWTAPRTGRTEGQTKNAAHLNYNVEYTPADISVICAVSSHGKTAFLVQSALDMVAEHTDKTFLYVSCEENKRQLVERMLNAFINIDTTSGGTDEKGEECFITGHRRETIKTHIKTKGSVLPEIYSIAKEGFLIHELNDRIEKEIQRYAKEVRPRLLLVHTDATVESICGNISYTIQKLQNAGKEIGGVFLDYMQLLSTDGRNYSRHDELKDICRALKDCASRTDIPFVIAAQLNREGIKEGIDSITIANIGEGADIERIAHDIYFLWQIDKTKQDVYFTQTTYKKDVYEKINVNGKEQKQLIIHAGEEREERNETKIGDRVRRIFRLDPYANYTKHELKSEYLYIERLKARDSKTGVWGLLKWDAERGLIGETSKKAMEEEF